MYPVSRECVIMLSPASEVVMMSLAIINSETPLLRHVAGMLRWRQEAVSPTTYPLSSS